MHSLAHCIILHEMGLIYSLASTREIILWCTGKNALSSPSIHPDVAFYLATISLQDTVLPEAVMYWSKALRVRKTENIIRLSR